MLFSGFTSYVTCWLFHQYHRTTSKDIHEIFLYRDITWAVWPYEQHEENVEITSDPFSSCFCTANSDTGVFVCVGPLTRVEDRLSWQSAGGTKKKRRCSVPQGRFDEMPQIIWAADSEMSALFRVQCCIQLLYIQVSAWMHTVWTKSLLFQMALVYTICSGLEKIMLKVKCVISLYSILLWWKSYFISPVSVGLME